MLVEHPTMVETDIQRTIRDDRRPSNNSFYRKYLTAFTILTNGDAEGIEGL
jgi:hypothetical protein